MVTLKGSLVRVEKKTPPKKKKVKGEQPKKIAWSELAATNAPVKDEPVEPVSRMNISLPASVFFFPGSSLPQNSLPKKFSTSPLLPSSLLP